MNVEELKAALPDYVEDVKKVIKDSGKWLEYAVLFRHPSGALLKTVLGFSKEAFVNADMAKLIKSALEDYRKTPIGDFSK